MKTREEWHFSAEELTVYDLLQMKKTQVDAGASHDSYVALIDLVSRRAVPPATPQEFYPLTLLEWFAVLERFYASIAEVNDGTNLIRKHGVM